MLIIVLDNQKQPPEVFYKGIVLKDFSNFTGKPVLTTLLERDSNTGVFL